MLVGAVWGLTNAWMKLADASYTRKEGANELMTLLMNWRWVLAFLSNQMGSILFYLTLKDADLSMAVPTCQATTLVFTVVGAVLMGEQFEGDVRCMFSKTFHVIFELTLLLL